MVLRVPFAPSHLGSMNCVSRNIYLYVVIYFLVNDPNKDYNNYHSTDRTTALSSPSSIKHSMESTC